MTLEEATKIALICSTADGGCNNCVGDLMVRLNETFPEFEWGYNWKAERVAIPPGQDYALYAPITVKPRP